MYIEIDRGQLTIYEIRPGSLAHQLKSTRVGLVCTETEQVYLFLLLKIVIFIGIFVIFLHCSIIATNSCNWRYDNMEVKLNAIMYMLKHFCLNYLCRGRLRQQFVMHY